MARRCAVCFPEHLMPRINIYGIVPSWLPIPIYIELNRFRLTFRAPLITKLNSSNIDRYDGY